MTSFAVKFKRDASAEGISVERLVLQGLSYSLSERALCTDFFCDAAPS